MAPNPRDTKEEFLRFLGLNWDRTEDKPKYLAMRDEAVAVYARVCEDRTNLRAELVSNAEITPPFFWHHVRPEVQRWAIEEVWRNASPLTRPFYDRGATTGEHGPNAVIKWLLYSVFRSRDDRNDRTKRKTRESGRGGGGDGGRGSGCGGRGTGAQTTTMDGSRYYDPARNGYI